ncbi:unnamed protein product [Lactuca saligna]|uniref:non-specific serine/threonine protein kinase n=1 Tax=Lactuca saligna TaxID=75948 RepID=A0AA35YGC2_LACSI|nr:unnamed protein product [Lactuca saligna]
MTLGECEIACRRNCSCTAYANLDIRKGGSGCLLWFGELMDLKVCEESQDLYIRMPSSLVTGLTVSQPGFNRKIQILTVVLSILLVLMGMSVAVHAFRMKKKRSYMKGRGRRVHSIDRHNSDVQKEDLEMNFFSLSIITKATNNFSINNKLGEGGFGPVYKGVLETGQEIAVKQLSRTSEQGYDEFYNEVVCVAKLQHRNLVKLVGYCMDGEERILIYEYLSNKSLDLLLFDETKSCMLDWPQRFCIINGIARGMLYLHQDSRLRIIHRDLKAANILLDHDMNPKISDFGLAREFEGNQITAKTKKVVGTYGYISPEYALHGRFSVKSDVFSFGVLVLEIVSGKKNREFSHEDLSDNLLGHAWRLYTEGKYLELMSPSLHNSCIISEVKRSIHVGLLCVQNHAQDRPTMSSVVMMLGGEGSLPPPRQPAFFAEEDSPKLNTYSGVDEATITLLHPRSFRSRAYLSPQGHQARLNWVDPIQAWIQYAAITVDMCAQHGQCGPNGICDINKEDSPIRSTEIIFLDMHGDSIKMTRPLNWLVNPYANHALFLKYYEGEEEGSSGSTWVYNIGMRKEIVEGYDGRCEVKYFRKSA